MVLNASKLDDSEIWCNEYYVSLYDRYFEKAQFVTFPGF